MSDDYFRFRKAKAAAAPTRKRDAVEGSGIDALLSGIGRPDIEPAPALPAPDPPVPGRVGNTVVESCALQMAVKKNVRARKTAGR